MSTRDFSDELFDSMTPPAGQVAASQRLRDSLLLRTTRTIRTRRRLRRAGIAAALLGCYLGGIATVSLRPGGHEAGRFTAERAESVAGSAVRKLVRPEDDQIAAGAAQPATARLTSYERLRRAGDRRLEKYADITGATRNYEKALRLASSDQGRIAPDRDTWLLMALKQASNQN